MRNQKKIPFINTKNWDNITVQEAEKKAFSIYQEIYQNKKEVLNIHKKILIKFIRDGGRKLTYGGKAYIEKFVLIEILEDVIKYAIYCNYKKRKPKDKKTVIGYYNFKCKVKINNKIINIRINIQLRTDGNFYYNHDQIYLENKKRAKFNSDS